MTSPQGGLAERAKALLECPHRNQWWVFDVEALLREVAAQYVGRWSCFECGSSCDSPMTPKGSFSCSTCGALDLMPEAVEKRISAAYDEERQRADTLAAQMREGEQRHTATERDACMWAERADAEKRRAEDWHKVADGRAAALAAAEQQRQQLEAHLSNLLARIFRDGGQRQAEFATLDEAVAAADAMCALYIAGLEQRQRDVAQARREERERCAIEVLCYRAQHADQMAYNVGVGIAAAIRALEETKA